MFGEPVFCDNLVGSVGLDRDDNKNLTRRTLFILESVPAAALPRRVDQAFRLPRFLLSDTVRWRTICVRRWSPRLRVTDCLCAQRLFPTRNAHAWCTLRA